MYPGFNIYQSILSGSWQPSLPLNQDPARFDRLLQAVRSVNGCSCSTFYKRLAVFSGDSLQASGKEIQPEAKKLAGICGCAASNVFLDIPAAGSIERFYNLLTGYSLLSYEKWISRLLHDNCRNEAGKWYHYRLVGRLYSLLQEYLPAVDMPTELLLIACRTKAAIAILLHRLITEMPLRENGFHISLWPREELKSALAACDLALPARAEVMSLFDKATRLSQAPSPAPQPAAALAVPSHTSIEPQLPDDHPLNKIRNAFQEDTACLRRQAKKLLDNSNRQPAAAGNDTARRIDGATACRILGISRKTLQRLCNKNELAFVNFGGKYYYLLEDINNLANERSNKKKPGAGNKRPPGFYH